MNLRHLLPCFFLLTHAANAGTSANYTLAPDIVDGGGLRGTSTNYTVNGSAASGGAGSSARYSARTGFAGQLMDAAGISITTSPLTVNEGNTRQLSATLRYDDSTTAPLSANNVTWSVQSGPLSGISPGGLATATAVYQDTAAGVRGTYQTFISTLTLTVLNVLSDNFETYAGDGIPDEWQVLHFGINNPNAGPLRDPDSDGQNNLFEYNACLIPTSAASRLQFDFFAVPGHPEQKGLIFSPRFPGCSYTIRAANTPDRAASSPLTGGITTDSGEVRRVIDPDGGGSRKFYHLQVTRP